MQYEITDKGYELLHVGATHTAQILEAASDVAEDGVISVEELVHKLDISRHDAVRALNTLLRLGLVRPTTPSEIPEVVRMADRERLSHDV